MLLHVAAGTQRLEILERIISPLAAFDPVVELQVFHGPAFLTSPVIVFQHALHQQPVDLLPQLDQLQLIQYPIRPASLARCSGGRRRTRPSIALEVSRGVDCSLHPAMKSARTSSKP